MAFRKKKEIEEAPKREEQEIKSVEDLSPEMNQILELKELEKEIKRLETEIQIGINKRKEHIKYKKDLIEKLLKSEDKEEFEDFKPDSTET